MCLPMDAQVVNGEGEGRVHVADKNAGFVLRAVRMNRVAVAEAVRVVVANDSNPLIPDTNFQLSRKTFNGLTTANVRATKAPLVDPLDSRCPRRSHHCDSSRR